jgi:hypothetical protein
MKPPTTEKVGLGPGRNRNRQILLDMLSLVTNRVKPTRREHCRSHGPAVGAHEEKTSVSRSVKQASHHRKGPRNDSCTFQKGVHAL